MPLMIPLQENSWEDISMEESLLLAPYMRHGLFNMRKSNDTRQKSIIFLAALPRKDRSASRKFRSIKESITATNTNTSTTFTSLSSF
jgi:hypothetical protein